MAFVLAARHTLRRNAVPIAISLSATGLMLSRQPRMRLDSLPAASQPTVSQRMGYSTENQQRDFLDPWTIKQLSGGSLAGLALGVLVSVFSRTLVLLVGVGIMGIQIAQRYGINVLGRLNVSQRSNKVLRALYAHPAFNMSFGATFALAAFFHF